MDKGSIELFDIHGKILFREEWNADDHSLIRIQMNDHPSGIYFYRIMSDGIMVQGKAVKG